MPKVKASDIKSGNILRYNGQLVKLEEIIHRTPGNLRAFYQAKMRTLETGKIVENRFRPDEEVELCRVETKNYQLLYSDNDDYMIMDPDTFEQHSIAKKLFGDSTKYIQDGAMLTVSFEEGEAIIGESPLTVDLEVTYTEPAVKGDTTSGAQKYATLETGVEIRVPLFVNQGDKIKVDTRTGEYLERSK